MAVDVDTDESARYDDSTMPKELDGKDVCPA
jgi:hypothetical protein